MHEDIRSILLSVAYVQFILSERDEDSCSCRKWRTWNSPFLGVALKSSHGVVLEVYEQLIALQEFKLVENCSSIVQMSMLNEDDLSSNSELLSDIFRNLLDSIIVDVASESHRIARLGLDRNLDEEEEELRLSAEARARASDPSHSGEANGKYVVDIFGQTHPPVSNEIFECMNCGRSIMAGRFAPHLEKCMGKGRKARMKSTRSTTAAQNRYSRGSPLSNQPPHSNSTGSNRLSHGTSGIAGHEYYNGILDEP